MSDGGKMSFLRRLFRSEPREKTSTDAEPSPGRADIGWATDVGQVRTHNEDAVMVIEANQVGGEALTPFGLSVLADGMGGHQSGEVASALAARTVARHVTQQVFMQTLSSKDHGADQPSISEILVEAVNIANAAVATQVNGGGTTLTCALFMGSTAHLAHVGDSRAYMISDNNLEQLTRDHSLVDRLVEMGQLTEDEAASHPQKNVLYRAVGQSGVLEVDTHLQSIPEGGKLLLCSDGLWGMLEPDRMARIISRSDSNQDACDALVAAANEAGGRDNITVVLITPPPEG
jgi:protein phosphatase